MWSTQALHNRDMEPTKILTWKSVKRIQKLQVVGHDEPILAQCEPCLGEQIKTPSIELCHNLAKSTELGRWITISEFITFPAWESHFESNRLKKGPSPRTPRVAWAIWWREGRMPAPLVCALAWGVRAEHRGRRWVGDGLETDQRQRGTSKRGSGSPT
jgi:hypothetical protein